MRKRIWTLIVLLLLGMSWSFGGCVQVGDEGEGDEAPVIDIGGDDDENDELGD
jgi:hypothetical protein